MCARELVLFRKYNTTANLQPSHTGRNSHYSGVVAGVGFSNGGATGTEEDDNGIFIVNCDSVIVIVGWYISSSTGGSKSTLDCTHEELDVSSSVLHFEDESVSCASHFS